MHACACCRYFQHLVGDPATVSSNDSAPAAQQLCALSAEAPPVALDWTQKGDGLLCADACGGITMYHVSCTAGAQPLSSRQSSEAPKRLFPNPCCVLSAFTATTPCKKVAR